MMLPRHRESRLDRALGKKAASKPTIAEMINAVALVEPLPDAPAEKPVAPAGPAPRIAQATVTPPEPALPESPPPPPAPPPWWEEMLGWHGPGPRPSPHNYDDGVRYETIHEYDPLEWEEDEE